MRKTINFKTLIEEANSILAASENSLTKQREGIATFIEFLLLKNRVYNGFNYLTKAQLKGNATIPGVNHCCSSLERQKYLKNNNVDLWRENCDETRKAFHIHHNLN